ncbi:hypothetical protein ART_1044 [Arthrobacter sp. PAMC 25486]|nr:hypothetical protein ART_1044 [Arthrobacter sp. PAMC 25486]
MTLVRVPQGALRNAVLQGHSSGVQQTVLNNFSVPEPLMCDFCP